jgi:alpha-tubulin suppressor-like RCC1 family protein
MCAAGSWVAVTAGDGATCGITSDARLKCWGNPPSSNFGQTDVPAEVAGAAVDSVSLRYRHACAILAAGKVMRCWGNNGNGQLEVPDVAASAWLAVSTGGYHTCGILAQGGKLRCWGNLDDSAIPLDLKDATFVSVPAGALHMCGILQSGQGRCWGDNGYGQRTVPSDVSSEPWASVSCGQYHTCVVLVSGRVRCWGAFVDTTRFALAVDTAVAYASTVESGWHHAIAIWSGSWKLALWGATSAGQATLPDDVAGFAWAAVAGGDRHTCGILAETGFMRCCGRSGEGQLNVPVLSERTVRTRGRLLAAME